MRVGLDFFSFSFLFFSWFLTTLARNNAVLRAKQGTREKEKGERGREKVDTATHIWKRYSDMTFEIAATYSANHHL